MKFVLKTINRNIPDQELLDDLKKIALKLGNDKMTIVEFNNNKGKYSATTIYNRFGTWNKALEKAGLKITHQISISENELFQYLEEVWIKLGHQPQRREMNKLYSNYSEGPYITRYGSWMKALETFVEYINSDDYKKDEAIIEPMIQEEEEEEKEIKHKTKRIPSERLKVQVLMRDGNKCALCGIKVTGENIHFDHIKPWAKGGETILENLQILCKTNNLVKGTFEYPEK